LNWRGRCSNLYTMALSEEIKKRSFWFTRKNRERIKDLFLFGLLGLILFLGIREGALNLRYQWHWGRVLRHLYDPRLKTPGLLLQGLGVTLEISFLSLGLSFVFGLLTALFRLSSSRFARFLARSYLEAIRNTPLLIQLFFIYFVVAPIFNMNAFFSALLALSLFEGAYASEIIRSGIISIPRGQWEAAYSLGLSSYRTYRHVVLPQTLRQILPPLSSQAISLIKDSALVSTIAIYDLTMRAQAIVAETFLTFEIWFTVAGIYLVINLLISFLVHLMERKIKRAYR